MHTVKRNVSATAQGRMLLAVILLFSMMSSCNPGGNARVDSQPVFSAERLERLTDMLNSYVEAGQLSGGVTLVLHQGRDVYYEAFGQLDRESGKPMTKDALFRIASQSKAIIAVAVMILQEQGKLLIEDPVGKYLPEFMNTTVWEDGRVVPARRRITIRHLLTHTAGIGYGWGPVADYWQAGGVQGWYFADRDEPVRETVRRMAALPMETHPGERFVYGYANDILGAMIEVISGQPLDVFLKEHIFDPLGMPDTFFFVPEEKAGRLATVYSYVAEGLIERAPDPGGAVGQGHYVKGPRKSFSGGAGLVSTARDYGRFLQMMLNGGTLDGNRILSPHTVQLMTVNHLDGIPYGPGRGLGLGFEVLTDLGLRGTPGAVGDYGWGGAYHSTYWVSPKDELVVVFFTQLLPAGNSDLHGKLRALIYQAKLR